MTFTTFECTHGIYKSNGNVSGGSRGFAFGGFFSVQFSLEPTVSETVQKGFTQLLFFFSLFLNIATCLSFSLKLVITTSQRKSIDPTCANPPPSKRRKKKKGGDVTRRSEAPKTQETLKAFPVCLTFESSLLHSPQKLFSFSFKTHRAE